MVSFFKIGTNPLFARVMELGGTRSACVCHGFPVVFPHPRVKALSMLCLIYGRFTASYSLSSSGFLHLNILLLGSPTRRTSSITHSPAHNTSTPATFSSIKVWIRVSVITRTEAGSSSGPAASGTAAWWIWVAIGQGAAIQLCAPIPHCCHYDCSG